MIGFWIVAGLLTAAVVALLARPLMRKGNAGDLGAQTSRSIATNWPNCSATGRGA